MKQFKTILFLFGLIIVSGCLPEPLPVDGIPQLKPKIVVSTRLTSAQSVIVLLTKSVGALDASDDSDPEELISQIAINDARVVLQHESVTYLLEWVDNGLYTTGQIQLEPGQEYTLHVESPSMGRVQATTSVKRMVPFDFLEAQIFYNGYDTLAQISYGFTDPPGDNFYMLNVQRLTRSGGADDIINPEIFTELLNDESFTGNEYIDRIRIAVRRDFIPGDTLWISLSNISQEYFDFMTVRIDSRFNFSDFLGEPANYPSNVEGGLGFFNLYIPDVRILELQD